MCLNSNSVPHTVLVHSILQAEGELYAFGRNSNGQLGNGSTEDSSAPKLVEALKVRNLAESRSSTARLLSCAPCHVGAFVCDPTVTFQGSLQQLPAGAERLLLHAQGHVVTAVSCGAEHSVVATDAGEVRAAIVCVCAAAADLRPGLWGPAVFCWFCCMHALLGCGHLHHAGSHLCSCRFTPGVGGGMATSATAKESTGELPTTVHACTW